MYADLVIHSALQNINGIVLEIVPVSYPMKSQEVPMMQSMMECYNVIGGPNDGDDPRNINIPEFEGIQDIMAPKMMTDNH